MNKKAKEKWLDEHKGAVKVSLSTGTNLITSKQLLAEVVSGEAAVFTDKTSYVVYAMPGDYCFESYLFLYKTGSIAQKCYNDLGSG